MDSISALFAEFSDVHMAKTIGNNYDDTRIQYRLESNRVSSEAEYYHILGDFYSFMSTGAQGGGTMSLADATSMALQIIQQSYRSRAGDPINAAYQDAHSGINGGLNAQLNLISDGMKHTAYENHIENVLRKHIGHTDFDRKTEFARKIIEHFQSDLPDDIDFKRPEKYANDVHALVRVILANLKKISAEFRRI